ncbi:MAG: DegT/DnrJ/EryC1/StrS family aminotransferase [Lentisphaerae bacterium]|nr:DegT/DnrJ/EryC1/StrS family aminotransferase [Lentisphaerota bacterium]
MQVPLLDLVPQYKSLKNEFMKVMEEVCDSQRFILGDKVAEFEKAAASYCQTNDSIGVTSGSDALIIALMEANIGAGDEVITSTFTFFATAGAIARVGATPVFCDIDPVTFNIDVDSAAAKVTGKTKAIIPVHLFGQAADMGKVMALAEKHNLVVIEDACQAIGAEYNGKRVGSIGDFGCFSFFPSKNLGCFGDGGLVSVQCPERAARLRMLRNHGQGGTYVHNMVGGNFRLDALQAAVLSIKLPHLDSWSAARQKNAAEYEKLFAAAGLADKIVTPKAASYANRHIYNQYSILVKDGKRDALKAYLQENGIGCAVYYPLCLHLQECFKNLGGKAGDCPVAEQISGEILALPIYPESTTEMREYVVNTIKAFFNA